MRYSRTRQHIVHILRSLSFHPSQAKMTPTVFIANFTQDWVEILQQLHLDYLIIPSMIFTVATLVANPVLLACITLSRALRRETRYQLVANTLVADLLYLIHNLSTTICNVARAQVPWLLCELLNTITITSHCCAILTVTLMVADTYAAVRWPLRYHDMLPPSRTRAIMVGVWLLSAVYPSSLMFISQKYTDNSSQRVNQCVALISLGFLELNYTAGIHIYFIVGALICASLILYCYIRLYMVTRTQGIWQSRFSRARVTVLTHGFLLLLYFAPGFIFILELSLFQRQDISQNLRVWTNMLNLCVFMLLPRAFAPYIYGLRYREISETLMQLLPCRS